ncbi:MAG TPA: sugar phosphate isomerase/epimerase [Bacteroides sp.]|nr:sugar phosphate isomerase/epimerase [Bacteroides sp.]
MNAFHPEIVAAYLYIIGKYGYPPPVENGLIHLEELASLGFRSIELEGIREEHLTRVYEMRHQLKEKANILNLKIPVFCIVLPGLSSADNKERERNLALFEKGCELAVDLGAVSVLDNAPIPPWQFPDGIPVTRHYDDEILRNASLLPGLNWGGYWKDLASAYREACEIAAKYDLTYHLHPCHGALVATTDSYLRFHDAVGMDNLRFNLDTANQFFLKDNLSLSLLRLAGHIDYIHISDNRGQRVEHLVPGDGAIDWPGFFEMLDRIGYRGLFGIDVGGDESDVQDYEKAYSRSAIWLEENWFNK